MSNSPLTMMLREEQAKSQRLKQELQKCKSLLEQQKANEDAYKKQIAELQEQLRIARSQSSSSAAADPVAPVVEKQQQQQHPSPVVASRSMAKGLEQGTTSSASRARQIAPVPRLGSGGRSNSPRSRPGSASPAINAILTPRGRTSGYGEQAMDRVDGSWSSGRGSALTPRSRPRGGDVERERRLATLMQHDLTDADLRDKKLREYFELFDAGAARDGFINREEFKTVYMRMESFGRTPSQAETDALFARFDYSGDNKLSLDEFGLLMAHRIASM